MINLWLVYFTLAINCSNSACHNKYINKIEQETDCHCFARAVDGEIKDYVIKNNYECIETCVIPKLRKEEDDGDWKGFRKEDESVH